MSEFGRRSDLLVQATLGLGGLSDLDRGVAKALAIIAGSFNCEAMTVENCRSGFAGQA